MHHIRPIPVALSVFLAFTILLLASSPPGAGARGAALTFLDPVSVAIDRSGDVYVFQRGTSSITKLSPTGRLLATWPVKTARTFPGPGRLAVDGAGRISILLGNSRKGSSYMGGIERLSSGGHVLARWYNAALLNSELLAAGTGGTVFAVVPTAVVSATHQTGRVVALAANGTVHGNWPLPTAGHDFMAPTAVAVDARGNVYVSGTVGSCSRGCQGREADVIERFTPTGRVLSLRQFLPGTIAVGPGLAVDAQGYMYSGGTSTVLKLSPGGAFVTRWGSLPGCSPLQFRSVAGLAIDAHHTLYVVDESDDNVHRLDTSSQSAVMWGGCPSVAPPAPILPAP